MRHGHTVGTVTGDQLVVRGSCDSWEANEPPKCRSYTAAARLELSTIRATRARFITLRELLSEPVLLRSCTVALFHWYRCRWCQLIPSSLYPRIGTSPSSFFILSYHLPLYYLPPPLLHYSYSSYLFNSSLRDLTYHPSPSPSLLLSTLLLQAILTLVVRQSFSYSFFTIVQHLLAGRKRLKYELLNFSIILIVLHLLYSDNYNT